MRTIFVTQPNLTYGDFEYLLKERERINSKSPGMNARIWARSAPCLEGGMVRERYHYALVRDMEPHEPPFFDNTGTPIDTFTAYTDGWRLQA